MDSFWLNSAFYQANCSLGNTGKNPAVGCILVKNNKIVGFAADQVPKRGFGEYINFFNVEAYTTTLVQSLVKKTKANVMYFFIQTSPSNDLNIILKHCKQNIHNDSGHSLWLNKDIEKFIMNRPADYSWEYKRFKRSKNLPNNFYEDT